jgi:ribonucleoside-diphosphate reductase alpha chain
VGYISGNTTPRNRLPNRRVSETFEFENAGLKYTCTFSRFPDGRCSELFLSNHKSNSSADNTARDAAIIASIALQHSADVETIRKGLSRDSHGRAMSPVAAALDRIAQMEAE